MLPSADYWIKHLHLQQHVEGGAFRETYRSAGHIGHAQLHAAFHGDRAYSTAIYFLLQHGQFSALHRIASDEVWHFYEGQALTIYELDTDGQLHKHQLGRNVEAGERFQLVIKAGSWFGSRCEVAGGYSLVGCTVAPGFDFADFELAARQTLTAVYPQHTNLIQELTYTP